MPRTRLGQDFVKVGHALVVLHLGNDLDVLALGAQHLRRSEGMGKAQQSALWVGRMRNNLDVLALGAQHPQRSEGLSIRLKRCKTG